ncbi:hypothetical protein ACFL16_03780, partial [Patescibacteria group bacterium]
FSCCTVYAADFVRDSKITEKGWKEENGPAVFGRLTVPPLNDNHCGADEGDLALNFDISIFARLSGDSFDVDDIYIDGVGMSGEYALNSWLETWEVNEEERAIPPLNGYDWNDRNIVSFCIGTIAQGFGGVALQNIVLWYDGPIETTYHATPTGDEENSSENDGPSEDISTVKGSLEVCNTGQDPGDVGSAGLDADIDPEETPEPTYPNFKGIETTLKTLSGQEKYVWYKPEEMYMHPCFQNEGDADWEGDHDYVEVRYYLSQGAKEDSHNTWERVGIDYIQSYNLELGDGPKCEDDRLILANKDSIQPGNFYNIIACVDRTADQYNGDGDVEEIKESDNCVKEAVFYVAETPIQFFSDDQTFGWSNEGVIDGMVCTHILETVDPDSWDNNYLCTQNNEGIVWNSSGTVAGMRCYQVSESADPDTWHDNYLCVPEQSNLQFYWSSDERVSGKDCVQWFEPYDPHTWDDNYLCFDRDYVYVPPPPPPSIVVTNPESTDNWRSDSTKHIRWDRYNFPVQGSVKIEYSMDGGGSWRTIDSSTNNDGSRYWDMCNSYTTDSPNSYVRITSNEYGVSGTSQKFYIDHARGCD